MQVFSSEWFKHHQRKLVWFANTWLGRKVFGIDTPGHVVNISPEGCTQLVGVDVNNQMGRFITKNFVVGAPQYALRLRKYLYPIWAGMHAIDGTLLDRFPTLLPNFGFYSFTYGPSDEIYWNTGFTYDDGAMLYYQPPPAGIAWATARNIPSANDWVNNPSVKGYTTLVDGTSGSYVEGISRVIIPFDTAGSGVFSGALILYADLDMWFEITIGNPSYLGWTTAQGAIVWCFWSTASTAAPALSEFNIARMHDEIGEDPFNAARAQRTPVTGITNTFLPGTVDNYVATAGSGLYTRIGQIMRGDRDNVTPSVSGSTLAGQAYYSSAFSYYLEGDYRYAPQLTLGYNAPVKVNVADTWRTIYGLKINIADVWHTVQSIKVNVGDVWKDVY